MITADYHFHVAQVKRSAGHSVTEMAAYRACERLHSDYYHETYDFTKKQGLIYSEILIPDYVPEKFRDRETLWNEVEFCEKRSDAQLAYNFDFSLQSEFTNEENIEIAQKFILENFIGRGMICDWSFHYPTENDKIQNPHIHMLCPIRPMNKDGTWGEKQKLISFIDKDGTEKKKAVKTTDWSDSETLIEWRKAWAEINNEMFEKKGMPERISADSFETRGIDRLPTIHEGPNVRAMEAKGIVTERGEYNRWVKKINQSLKLIHEYLGGLLIWVKDFAVRTPKDNSLIDLLNDYTAGRNYGAYSNTAKANNLKTLSAETEYLISHNIFTPADLEKHIQSVKEGYDKTKADKDKIKKQVDMLNSDLKTIKRWEAVKPIGEQYEKRKLGRDKYYREHEKEIRSYYFILKNKKNLIGEDSEKKAKSELKKLMPELKSYDNALGKIEKELRLLKAIQHGIDVALGNMDDAVPVEIDGRKVFIEKKDYSMQARLNKAKKEADEYNRQKGEMKKDTAKEIQ